MRVAKKEEEMLDLERIPGSSWRKLADHIGLFNKVLWTGPAVLTTNDNKSCLRLQLRLLNESEDLETIT